MVVHKKDIIDKIAVKTGLKKMDIEEMLNAFAETVYEELKNDNSITLKKLFKLEPVIREERQRYNPATGEYETVEEHKTVKMTPSPTLKEIIRDAPSDTEIQYDLEKLTLERKIKALMDQKERLESKMSSNTKKRAI